MLQTLLALAMLTQGFRQEYVRVTYYNLYGTTFSGEPAGPGVAACSKWIPLGSVLEFGDGLDVTCLDRGLGDYYWKGWVDIWSQTRPPYDDYEWVSVLCWGPCD